jgi:hypothetical protein
MVWHMIMHWSLLLVAAQKQLFLTELFFLENLHKSKI